VRVPTTEDECLYGAHRHILRCTRASLVAGKDPNDLASLFAAALEEEEGKAKRPRTTGSTNARSTGKTPTAARATPSPPSKETPRPPTAAKPPAQPQKRTSLPAPQPEYLTDDLALPTLPIDPAERPPSSKRNADPAKVEPRKQSFEPARVTEPGPRTLEPSSSRLRTLPVSTKPPVQLPMPESKPLFPTVPKRPSMEIRGKPAHELNVPVEPTEELDHKGRSKPLYARRTKRPEVYKPPPLVDFALGLFPGARLMAREKVVSGLSFAVIGLFALLPALIVLGSWAGKVASFDRLYIDHRWLFAHAAVAVIGLLTFELLRFASSMDRIKGHLRATRGLAALLLPSLVVAVFAPMVVSYAPSLFESAWLVGLGTTIVGLLAFVDCLPAKEGESSGGGRRTMITAIVIGVALLAGLGLLSIGVDTSVALERSASDAGFQIVPKILRALRLG
jgi:hypothetical protein